MNKEILLARLNVPAFYRTHLPSLKITGKAESMALCPFHDDRTPSFSVNLESGLWNCMAGCGGGDVFGFYQRLKGVDFPTAIREIADQHGIGEVNPKADSGRRPSGGDHQSQKRIGLPPPDAPKPIFTSAQWGEPTGVWDYRTADGALIGYVVRYDPPGGKEVRPYSWDQAAGEWIQAAFKIPRPLYGLELLAARPTDPVMIVEGEKAADAARRIVGEAYVVVTWPGGAKAVSRGDWSPLHGREVVLWPDADRPGIQAMEELTRFLRPHCLEIKVIDVTEQPEGWDLADAEAEGWDWDLLVEWAKPRARVVGGSPEERIHSESHGYKDWPEPDPLPEVSVQVPPMSGAMIPGPFRDWLVDITDRTQCPLEYPAVGAIVSIGALIGRGVGIRPKRQDDWLVIPNLWGGIVGPPGFLKTPALIEASRPLHRLEMDALKAHEAALKDFEKTKIISEAQKKATERKIQESLKKGMDPSKIAETFDIPSPADAPIPKRLKTNDCTIEKLGVLLNENPRGILVFRDELTGLLRTLDREGHEGDRAFYLEGWNGNGSFTYDRISRGTVHIDGVCVSILGGIQPGPLGDYLRSAIRGGAGDDGLIQRIQLSVYPDPPKTWVNVDRWPDSKAKNLAYEVFRRIDALNPQDIGAESDEDEGIPFLRFSQDAQLLFNEWRSDLEAKILAGEEHPVIEGHLSKYRSLMPSLALIFHLIEVVAGRVPPGPVSHQAAKMAAAWCDFLEAHARKIYQIVTEKPLQSANLLAKKIESGKVSSPFGLRDIYRNCWSGLTTPDDAREAVEILEDAGWVRSEFIEDTGGRSKRQFVVNPRLRKEQRS